MQSNHLIIATRESPLALWQALWVKDRLEAIHPHLTVSLLGMTTKGDRLLETPLMQIGGKGLFVKELEEALLDERADIAVHSMKDVPMVLPPGLILPVMCDREEPRDVFVSNQFSSIDTLPVNAVVGTSSLRRQSQLRAWRSDLRLDNVRGNVGTRLQKLDNGEYSAIILAAAGLKRLGLEKRIRAYLSIEQSLPAAGQGVLGIECRENDDRIQQLIAPLNHSETQIAVLAERALCTRLGGGCQVPLASYAEIRNGQIELQGLVARVDGTHVVRAQQVGSVHDPYALGIAVAEDLIRQGAEDILRDITS